jgi:hypothetical protein
VHRRWCEGVVCGSACHDLVRVDSSTGDLGQHHYTTGDLDSNSDRDPTGDRGFTGNSYSAIGAFYPGGWSHPLIPAAM